LNPTIASQKNSGIEPHNSDQLQHAEPLSHSLMNDLIFYSEEIKLTIMKNAHALQKER
jgi:hypothetical protein